LCENAFKRVASIAVRNLFHDKVRLAVTLTGIVFAVVLVCIQIGLFLGFSDTTSSVIDHSNADLWMMSKGVRYLEEASRFSERKLYQVLTTPGVASAHKEIVELSDWKRPDGGQEVVEVIGFDPNTSVGGPWNVVEGQISDLKIPDAVMIDRLYARKLGVEHIGQICEIHDHRARVVGFTRGIRTFTTAATAFTTFKNAQTYESIGEDQTLYILIRTVPGADVQEVKRQLMERVKDVDVWTRQEFARRTTFYWMFSTGAGVSVLIAAVLGLLVGIVVVAQTIYAATVDHIREFGTLKAMGASNGYIYRIILEQATISAVIGYVLGILLTFAAVRITGEGAPILLPKELITGMFLLTLAMCCAAALVSINKVTHIDPAMVFKG
jgi:putative ABC transport system permease protein